MHVVGARPNFVKMAPIIDALAPRDDVSQVVVHTGQHYDERMSGEMLSDLGLPEPDVFLGVGSGTHGSQTGRALIAFEEVLLERRPDLVCAGGDVNSTLAVALASAKLGIPVAHVEAGLRSFDWTMPEEINRVLTDRLSTLLFTHSPEAATNLEAEGIDASRVHFVGNTMIDSLRRFEDAAVARRPWERAGVNAGAATSSSRFTARRTSTSRPNSSASSQRCSGSRSTPAVIFPVHPRTRARLAAAGLLERLESAVHCMEPVGYLDFLGLEAGAGAIVTDSGGVQEEASAFGIPCFTLRANTERPVTITSGHQHAARGGPRPDRRHPAGRR